MELLLCWRKEGSRARYFATFIVKLLLLSKLQGGVRLGECTENGLPSYISTLLCLRIAKLPMQTRGICSATRIPISVIRHAPCNGQAAKSGSNLASFRSRSFSMCRASSSNAAKDIAVSGKLEIQRIKCLSDNYAWLITSNSMAAIVDPSEAGGSFFLSAR